MPEIVKFLCDNCNAEMKNFCDKDYAVLIKNLKTGQAKALYFCAGCSDSLNEFVGTLGKADDAGKCQ